MQVADGDPIHRQPDKECLGKRVAKIVRAETGREFCGPTKLRSDLTNAPFGQRSTLTKKKMSVWEADSRPQLLLPGSLLVLASVQPDIRSV